MRGFLCKIFRFALDLFSSVVTVVAEAVKLIGSAAIDVLDELFEAGGSLLSGILGSPGKLLMLGLVGYGAYVILTDDEDEDKDKDKGKGNSLTDDGVTKDGI